MFCFKHLGPTSVFSGDREHARKTITDKSHTNLPQRKCVVEIVYSKQESLEKLKQSGSKANSTLEPGKKGLFSLKMQNSTEPPSQGSWEKESQGKTPDWRW